MGCSGSSVKPENKKKKIAVIFYSTYGHLFELAEQIAKGARTHPDVEQVDLFRVEETLPDEVIGKMGGLEVRKKWMDLPVVDHKTLDQYDGLAFGTPTRFGGVAAQFKTFLDRLGQHWMSGSLVGKLGTCFSSSGEQHGGNEMTLITLMVPMLHLGMGVVGLPSSEYVQKKENLKTEVSGGTPYGMTSIAGNNRKVSSNELDGGFFQGQFFARMVTRAKPE